MTIDSGLSAPPSYRYYRNADEFFQFHQGVALTFDDISLVTNYSEVLPRETDLTAVLSDQLRLQVPMISSDMDTVTESRMAIAMALNGGMGIIHYNMPAREQINQVTRVKHHIHGLIQHPITVDPGLMVGDVLALISRKNYNFRTFPVVDEQNRLLGLLTGKVVKERYANRLVSEAMTPRRELYTLSQEEVAADPIAAADVFFNQHIGIHKLLIVDDENHLRGLITISDIEQITAEARAARKPSRDSAFRLVVAAAIHPRRNPDGTLDRAAIVEHVGHLADESIDAVAVSTAHGHTRSVGEAIRLLRSEFPDLTLIAGNVTSAEGVDFLAECGANCIKIGQGPGSICTTRIVAGVGVPQMTALYVASRAAKRKQVSLLADGGISKSGDIVKALTLADAVICGGLFAGCREAPGELVEIGGKLYKQYRGMGSLSAMQEGSAARYGHDTNLTQLKLTAEGIEGLKEVSGSLANVMDDLVGGLRSGMGYLGAATLEEAKTKARYVRMSPSGYRESVPHDVIEVSKKKE